MIMEKDQMRIFMPTRVFLVARIKSAQTHMLLFQGLKISERIHTGFCDTEVENDELSLEFSLDQWGRDRQSMHAHLMAIYWKVRAMSLEGVVCDSEK